MNSSAESQGRRLRFRSWRSSLVGVLLAVASIYVWILPLFQPRGDLLWGHYRLIDIYIGIPIALATLCAALILAVPNHYRSHISIRVITVGIAVLLAFAVSDVVYAFGVMGALRANYWLDQAHIPRRYSTADPELGFVRKPFVSWRGYIRDANRVVQYRTDKNGFRNSTEQQRADIVFIGDSFTESATVTEADTFVRRVAHATGMRAVNLGRGAYGPQQELIVLKRYGLSYRPRFVVWQLFEGNDVADAEVFAEWKQNPHRVNTSLKERYFENSLLKHWLTRTRSQKLVEPVVTLRYHDGTSRRASLRYAYDPDQLSKMVVGMSETLKAIQEGQQFCQSHGIQLLVVVVPTMIRVMQPYISFDRVEERRDYFPERKSGDNGLSDTLEKFCAEIGCSFVDSFSAMSEAGSSDNRGLYIPTDEHLDIRGHEVMSRVITDWIRSRTNAAVP